MHFLSRTTRLTAGLILAAVATGFATQQHSFAYPGYKTKEGVGCTYCHVKPGGPRNYRGAFYKKNSLTFAGFDDAAVAAGAGADVLPAKVKPTSLTTPTPVTDAYANIALAKDASDKAPTDAKLTKAYYEAQAAYAHSLLGTSSVTTEAKYAQVIKVCDAVLATDPKNKAVAADKKAAEAGLKAEKTKTAAAIATAAAVPAPTAADTPKAK